MKMTKKILVAALAVATLGLTSCIGSIGGGEKIIKGKLSASYVDFTYTKEDGGDDFYREINTSRTPRKNTIVKITMESAEDARNVMGAAWDQTQNEDGTWNFFVSGIRMANKNAQYYVSFFGNIKEEDMGKSNFGATLANGEPNYQTTIQAVGKPAYEIRLTGTKESYGYVTFADKNSIYKNGTLSVVISIKAEINGIYTVKYFVPNADEDNMTNNALKEYYLNDSTPTIASFTSTAANAGVTQNGGKWYNLDGTELEEGIVEAGLGWYAMVHTGTTLKGNWDTYDISGEPIEE